MRKFIPFVGIIILFLVFCTDSPTSGPSGQDSDYVLIDTVLIGNSGGTIEAEDFKLTVPPGAFDSPVKLELYASSDDQPFGEYTNSRTFKIGNFPAQFNQPLEVKVKYNLPITGNALLAMREVSVSSSIDTISTAFRLAPACEADGYLIYQIQPLNIAKSSLDKNLDDEPWYAYFNATWGYNIDTTKGKHFAVAYPSVVIEEKAKDLGTYLEDAYKKFESMNFDYSSRTEWPMDVTIKKPTWHDYPMKETTRGLYRYGFGTNWGSFTFHQDTVLTTSAEQIRTLAGHEFFHFVQYMYYYYTPGTLNHKYIWISEASSTWSEHLFTSNPYYIPSVRKHNWIAPLLGAEYGAGYTGIVDENGKNPWSATRHGYGMSALIKYLVSKYGENVVIRIWNKIAVNTEVIAAIINIIPEANKATWWDDFLREYVLGNIYSDFHAADHALEYTIQTTDEPRKLTSQFPDLSGKLILIPLDFQNIQVDTEIRFSVSDPSAKITVFNLHKLLIKDVLGGPDVNVTVTDLKSLKDSGAELIILISNSHAVAPYTDLTQIDLEIEVGRISLFPYNHCRLWFWSRATFNSSKRGVYDGIVGLSAEVDGSMKNDWFTGTYEQTYLGDDHKKELRVNLDLENHTIIGFQVNGSSKAPDPDGLMNTWSIKNGEKALKGNNENSYFYVRGTDVEQYVGQLTYKSTWKEPDEGTVTEEITKINYDSDSVLEFNFIEE